MSKIAKNLYYFILFSLVTSSCGNRSIPLYFKKQVYNDIRYLVEYSQINSKTPENRYYIDAIILHESNITGNKCIATFNIDNQSFQNVPCSFGAIHARDIIQSTSVKNKESLNEFDVSQFGVCLLFDDLSDFDLIPNEISIKFFISQPIFFGEKPFKSGLVIWAPNISEMPSLSKFTVVQEFYMFEGWDYQSNVPFAKNYLDNWVDNHYVFVDEYDTISAFFNDNVNYAPIIIN